MYYILHKATLNPLRNNILITNDVYLKMKSQYIFIRHTKKKTNTNSLKILKKVWHFNKICTFEIYIINSIANNTFWISKIRPLVTEQRYGLNLCAEIVLRHVLCGRSWCYFRYSKISISHTSFLFKNEVTINFHTPHKNTQIKTA